MFEAALANAAPDSAPHRLLALSLLRHGKAQKALGHLVTAKDMKSGCV
jgi:hypothetical protein